MATALNQVILDNRLPELFDAMRRALPATKNESDAALASLWDAVKGQGKAECAVVSALQIAVGENANRESVDRSLDAIPSGKALHFERNGLSREAMSEAIAAHASRLALWAPLFIPPAANAPVPALNESPTTGGGDASAQALLSVTPALPTPAMKKTRVRKPQPALSKDADE